MDRIENTPKVSICVVTYNQEKYIRQCLQSIADQETDFDFEVIVGEDCSTDGTRAIVQEFAAKYPQMFRLVLHEDNVGPTRNYLIVHSLARGELVCHCDGDDYWLPTKLQVQTDFMEQYPTCRISGHKMYLTDDGHSLLADGRGDLPPIMKISAFYEYGNFLPHSSTMYRASSERVPGIEGETIDLLVHIWRIGDGSIGFINQYLGVYLIHNASRTTYLSQSLQHFNFNLIALEEIHKIVKNTEEFEKRKFDLCKDCIKNFIASGRTELAKEIALNSRQFISKRRHNVLLNLMVVFGDFIRLAVHTKRRYLAGN